jgi:hypothetical protein
MGQARQRRSWNERVFVEGELEQVWVVCLARQVQTRMSRAFVPRSTRPQNTSSEKDHWLATTLLAATRVCALSRCVLCVALLQFPHISGNHTQTHAHAQRR